ncbi:TIGR04222 domain-containing membrane protein [Streptomyces sp. NBC_00306]|uniref:TIGR04222 domain-containing membrane protein n=1 Tax=Streptomyces sp. NBC_00306 TaxID=2975708 RepID=UPI002E27C332|nr:TIGR04222 domain-containing membrane protein [Streptomyces sp. NBC_00306]
MTVLAILVYVAVAASSTTLLVRVSWSQRRPAPGVRAQIHDVYEAAFLGGGPARVVDAALAVLHADGRLAIGGPGIAVAQRPVAQDLVERAVFDELAASPTGALHTLRRSVMRSPAVQEIGDGLAARGLMLPPRANRALTVWGLCQGFVCVMGIPFAFVVTVLSFVSGPDDPDIPFIMLVLPALFVGIGFGFTAAARSRRRISSAGQDALRSFGVQFAHLHSPAHLVALHGLHGVTDPFLQAQLRTAARTPVSRYERSAAFAATTTVVWCAASSPDGGGGSGCGSSSGSGCGGSSGGSGCGGSSGGSSCGGGGSSGGSSCGGGGSS